MVRGFQRPPLFLETSGNPSIEYSVGLMGENSAATKGSTLPHPILTLGSENHPDVVMDCYNEQEPTSRVCREDPEPMESNFQGSGWDGNMLVEEDEDNAGQGIQRRGSTLSQGLRNKQPPLAVLKDLFFWDRYPRGSAG